MAAYIDLISILNDSDFEDKVKGGILVAANDLLRKTTPTAAEKSWASFTLNEPLGETKKAVKSIIFENKGLTTTIILASTDSAIQTQVDTIVPVLVDAMAGV